ncbi:GL24102 [Drosophila persimilis]|uniref:GL24102 n=1 Tax=Drosophila persimilis TaxID=7234 RepID=B4G3M9_DROPE|nr:GL24102 [Drosophila persimilis]
MCILSVYLFTQVATMMSCPLPMQLPIPIPSLHKTEFASVHIGVKRGSDELLSQAAVMAPASDNNNQDLATKKAKLEPSTVLAGGIAKASKVIHLRNIPNESGESDVIALGVPFGRVTNVLVLNGQEPGVHRDGRRDGRHIDGVLLHSESSTDAWTHGLRPVLQSSRAQNGSESQCPHPISGRQLRPARQVPAGRTEHLQRVLHAPHRQQQADGPQREVQQRQVARLHESGAAAGRAGRRPDAHRWRPDSASGYLPVYVMAFWWRVKLLPRPQAVRKSTPSTAGGAVSFHCGGGLKAVYASRGVPQQGHLNHDVNHKEFVISCVYGDVQRVKILYNKKDSALIQMAEPQQAYLAMSHLDKLRLWGRPIRVMASKHQAVQLPKEGQPDAGLTRDYSQNPLHRFKKPGSKNYQNIYPPSATLHLSNIPSSCSEDDIKEAFTSNTFEVKAFKFFPKDRKMALLQLSSVEEAVLALIKMHNHQLSESNHLRVSFSKSNI